MYVETLLARNTYGYWTTGNILLGSAGLILLIACVNVAGLLLARGATRMHEVAIRASIGAGRGRLVRQLLTESLLLAAAGAALGLLLAWWTLDALVTNIPLPVSTNAPATLNARVLGFSVILTIVTGVLFGLAPALRLSRVRVSGALARGSRRTGAALSRRGGNWLIGVEDRAGARARHRRGPHDQELQPDGVRRSRLPARVVRHASGVAGRVQGAVFATYYTEPGRRDPAVAGRGSGGRRESPAADGHVAILPITTDDGKKLSVTIRRMTAGYFEALGLCPAARDGCRQPSDLTSGRRVAVINQRAAKRCFRRVAPSDASMTLAKEPMEVVGVVPDLRNEGGRCRARCATSVEVFAMYQPAPTDRPEPMVVVVRPGAERGRAAMNGFGRPRRLRVRAAIVERVRTGDGLARRHGHHAAAPDRAAVAARRSRSCC